MAIAFGRCLHIPSCSLTLVCENVSKPSFGVARQSWPALAGKAQARTCVAVARAQPRPTWLPGLDPPPYLDGR